MRIKKTFQGELPENKIVNIESNSQTDTYSCDYINNNIKPKIKRFNKFIKSGGTHTDTDILKAKFFVVIHYSIQPSGYLKSTIVQTGLGTWYWDHNSANNLTIYFRIDWATGTIYVSSSSTVSDAVGVVGYDILM